MKITLVSAAAIAAAIVAAAPAAATVEIVYVNGQTALGTPNPIIVPPTLNLANTQTVKSTDTAVLYQFVLGSTYTLSNATFTNTTGFQLSSFSLFKGLQTSAQTTGALGGGTALTSQFISAPDTVLTAGSYTLQINGTYTMPAGAVSQPSVAATGNFSVAAVPEPATWGLMVLGFGAIGGALRTSRRKVVFA